MKIFVKTLKGTRYKTEVKPHDSVADVKKKIEAVMGASAYPAAQQMLIHKGKVLKDGTTMVENNVSEKSVIAITKTQSKPASTGRTDQANAAPPSSTRPLINNGIPGSAARSETMSRRLSMLTPLPPGVSASAASNLVDESSLESRTRQILQMRGNTWDRDTLVRALRASFVNYCNSKKGISKQTANPPQKPEASQRCDPNSFYYVAEELLNNGSFDFLRVTELYKILQHMVQSNPGGIKSILEELGKQNPKLLRMIRDNKAQFLRSLIGEPLEGGESVNQMVLPEELQDYKIELLRFLNEEPLEGEDSGNQKEQSEGGETVFEVSVTPKEYEAIERLGAMGFERAVVIVVFFFFNTNEELATKFFLDHINHQF